MEFIRNVLIIGDKDGFQENLKSELLKVSSKVSVQQIKDRTLLSQKLGDTKVNSVFININNFQECMYIYRLLNMYTTNVNDKLSIFFTSEDFEVFQEVISSIEETKGFNVIPWPANPREVAEKIVDSIFNRKLSKQVVTKNNNVLNVDLEFVQVFIEATKHVLTEMGVVDLAHRKPTFKEQMDHPIEEGIASRIMISSKFFTGNFYVIFPEKSFLSLYESAVYETHEAINDENKDFAGELANIIYGHSKKVLSASGLALDMVIPSIHNSSNIESELVIVIPFDSSFGNFYIAVAPGEI